MAEFTRPWHSAVSSRCATINYSRELIRRIGARGNVHGHDFHGNVRGYAVNVVHGYEDAGSHLLNWEDHLDRIPTSFAATRNPCNSSQCYLCEKDSACDCNRLIAPRNVGSSRDPYSSSHWLRGCWRPGAADINGKVVQAVQTEPIMPVQGTFSPMT